MDLKSLGTLNPGGALNQPLSDLPVKRIAWADPLDPSGGARAA